MLPPKQKQHLLRKKNLVIKMQIELKVKVEKRYLCYHSSKDFRSKNLIRDREQFYEDKFTKKTIILNTCSPLITEFQNSLSKKN